MDAAAAPASRRIESLDFLRGCALFGILLMNIVGMGLGPAYDNPTVAGGDTGINLMTWFIINVGFEGTQRGLFSMLFGAGVILLTSRLEASGRADATDIYFRRNLWLIGFGLANTWVLQWGGDILYDYGIAALFLFAFRKLAGKTLLALGVGALVLGAAWSALETRGMLRLHDQYRSAIQVPEAQRTDKQERIIEEWKEESRAGPPPQAYAEARKSITASYWSSLEHRAERFTRAQSWEWYRYFFDVFGMMMVGMALFRLGVLTLELRASTYAAMMAGGYAIGLTANILEARWIMASGFTALGYYQAGITYDLSRLAMTVGHLGALMLFLRSGILPWLRRSMAAVGRMALTNYLTHSLVALVIFVLLGWWGALERHQLYYIVFGVWAFQIVISPVWLGRFHFGPVEWLWRYLTYGKKPPFRRDSGPALPPSGAVPVPAE